MMTRLHLAQLDEPLDVLNRKDLPLAPRLASVGAFKTVKPVGKDLSRRNAVSLCLTNLFLTRRTCSRSSLIEASTTETGLPFNFLP